MGDTSMPVFGAVEDLLLGILRPFFEGTDANVYAGYFDGMVLPAIVPLHARRSGGVTYQNADQAFTEATLIEVNTICEGPNADLQSAELQEACRHALLQAQREQITVPGVGAINRIQASTKATRQPDWATATGIVQYATLPLGAVRYEAVYKLLLRPDASTPTTNRYLNPVPHRRDFFF